MPVARSLPRLLLVLCLAASTQSLLFVQGMFALRQDYVVENLCVNRATPEVDCHGRCFLQRQMETRQEQEQRSAALEVVLAVSYAPPVAEPGVPPAPVRPAPTWTLAPAPAPTSGVPSAVFHPPRLA